MPEDDKATHEQRAVYVPNNLPDGVITHVDILINKRPFTVPYGDGTLSYKEVIDMIFPNTYERSHPFTIYKIRGTDIEGTMSDSENIKLQKGLIISVTELWPDKE